MAEPFSPYAGIEGAALTGGEGGDALHRLLISILQGTAQIPKNVIDATMATAPGLRREDFTDKPAPMGLMAAWQPGDEMRSAALEAAMLPMGTGAVAGVPMRAGEAVMGAGPIRAYHGSPHDFDKFDLSKIGTGEGAQAYGHGLYFAENEGVARSYRSINAPAGQGAGAAKLAHDALQMARDTGLDGPEARRFAMEYLTNQAPKVNALSPQHYYDAVNNFDAFTTGKGLHGKMYEVNINADPAHFLDWDKPLSAQPHVQDALAEKLLSQMPSRGIRSLRTVNSEIEDILGKKGGDLLYRQFSTSPRDASAFLRDEGIPGIKYLDQGSRGPVARIQTLEDRIAREKGQGLPFDHWQKELDALKAQNESRNYVLFDDRMIDILRKYGIGGVAPVGALASGLPGEER